MNGFGFAGFRLIGKDQPPWSELVVDKYFVLDEEMCLAIAENVSAWSRHLQRLCGKLEGQVPLSKTLMDHIMGCQFQCEGEVLTSRWAGA